MGYRIVHYVRCDVCRMGETVHELTWVPGYMVMPPILPNFWNFVDFKLICPHHKIEFKDRLEGDGAVGHGYE